MALFFSGWMILECVRDGRNSQSKFLVVIALWSMQQQSTVVSSVRQ